MKLHIESTDEITHLDGVACRVWKGRTGWGQDCVVFVHRIAVPDKADHEGFLRELKDRLPPGRVVPLAAVL